MITITTYFKLFLQYLPSQSRRVRLPKWLPETCTHAASFSFQEREVVGGSTGLVICATLCLPGKLHQISRQNLESTSGEKLEENNKHAWTINTGFKSFSQVTYHYLNSEGSKEVHEVIIGKVILQINGVH